MSKPVKRVRSTVVAVFHDTEIPPVSTRALMWEQASRGGNRRVHRVEYAGPTVDTLGAAFIIDLELECRGANRHDFTKFVRTYLPEASLYYVTEAHEQRPPFMG